MINRPAVFTIAQDETIFAPLWAEHYKKQGFRPEDIYLLEHKCLHDIPAITGINRLQVNNPASFDNRWLRDVASDFQRFLLKSYDVVVYSDADELILSDGGNQLAADIIRINHGQIRVRGYDIIHMYTKEAALDFQHRPLLSQRSYMLRNPQWDKPLIATQPQTWDVGFHSSKEAECQSYSTVFSLLHLHKIDFGYAYIRHAEFQSKNYSQWDKENKLAYQWAIYGKEAMSKWWKEEITRLGPVIEIPKFWQEAI